MIGRFAPSPTGRMHLGNIYSALLSWLSVKSQGGEWILRIEDLDPQRSHMDYALQAEDDLRWLGLTWDRGGTQDPNYIQSRRTAIYEEELQRLETLGLTYPCFCTRADIMATQAPHESDGRIVYAGTCRPASLRDKLNNVQFGNVQLDNPPCPPNPSFSTALPIVRAEGEQRNFQIFKFSNSRASATRLGVPDADINFVDGHYGPQTVNLARHCGDFVVQRADGAFAYQLAVVVDDARMGVTEVVRGRDLLLSSAQQIWLYRLLGYATPVFCHLPLLCNEAGQRLSKRDKSLDMGVLRERFTPEQIIGRLAYYAGQTDTPAPITLPDLLTRFSWDRVPTADVIVPTSEWE